MLDSFSFFFFAVEKKEQLQYEKKRKKSTRSSVAQANRSSSKRRRHVHALVSFFKNRRLFFFFCFLFHRLFHTSIYVVPFSSLGRIKFFFFFLGSLLFFFWSCFSRNYPYRLSRNTEKKNTTARAEVVVFLVLVSRSLCTAPLSSFRGFHLLSRVVLLHVSVSFCVCS